MPSQNTYGLNQSPPPLESQTSQAPVRALATPPAYTGGSTYVDGVGEIGPDIEGAAKGAMLRQEYGLKAATNARAEDALQLDKNKDERDKDYLDIAKQDLGIRQEDLTMRQGEFANKQEEFSWKRSEVERQKQIQQGMMEAGQAGGYTGVIEYLKQVDPEKAMKLHADKLKLDDSIMKNDVYKAAIPVKKAQAMADAYGVLGKMGAAILNAPADQRQAMYDNLKPIMGQVMDPADIPDSVDDPRAKSIAMLSTAQSMKENSIAETALGVNNAKDAIGKNMAAIKLLETKLANNPDDPLIQKELQARTAELDQYQAKLHNTQVQNTNYKIQKDKTATQIDNTQLNAALKVKDDLFSTSKPFVDFAENYKKVGPLLKIIDTKGVEGLDAQARVQLLQYVASMTEPGRKTDEDINRMATAAGYQSASKKIIGIFRGQIERINDPEIVQIKDMIEMLGQQQYEGQMSRERDYEKVYGGSFPNALDYDKVLKPSSMYIDTIRGKERSATIGLPLNYKNKVAPSIQDLEDALSDYPNRGKSFMNVFGVDPMELSKQLKEEELTKPVYK